MSDQLIVHIDGNIHEFWTSATIARSIERGAHSFELTLTDSFESNSKTTPRIIKRGMAVEVFINDERILTGYIDDVNPSYNAKTHTLQVTGRSKVGDLIDSSTDGKQFKIGQSLLQVANVCCLGFGITVIVDASAKTAANEGFISEHMLDVGQPIWEFLEELARIRAVLLVSDSEGNLVITRAGSALADIAIELGVNILAASGTFSNRSVFSEYTVCAQQASTPLTLLDTAAKTQPKGTVKSSTGRYRPNVVCSDNPTDSAGCKTRAEWQKNVLESRAESVVYTVQGWRQKDAGPMWQPNSLVSVTDNWMGWKGQFLITETRVLLDEKGSLTELKIMPKSAFDLIPENEPEPADKGWL